MKIDETAKNVIEGAAYLSLVTLNEDGTPHPIIVGKGSVEEENIVFGIYKMEQTQQNVNKDDRFWVVAATMQDGPQGYRFSGTAQISDGKMIFCPQSAESLI